MIIFPGEVSERHRLKRQPPSEFLSGRFFRGPPREGSAPQPPFTLATASLLYREARRECRVVDVVVVVVGIPSIGEAVRF